MNKFWAPSSLLLLCFAAALAVGCGSSNRQLQSITVNAVANGSQVQFVATGNFSASPTTVTPLPVSWFLAEMTQEYALTAQPFVVPCNTMGPAVLGPVTAMAPADPHAPSSGLIVGTKMVVGTTPVPCQ
jgi:hypothetical protein